MGGANPERRLVLLDAALDPHSGHKSPHRVPDGRTWDRSRPPAVPQYADLSRNRLVCRRFSKRLRRAISVLNHSFLLLVWSIGGQQALLMR